MSTRAEHLQWCKDRALEILDNHGSAPEAYTSFLSDMQKHDETKNHSALDLGAVLMFGGHLQTEESMRKFINDFN